MTTLELLQKTINIQQGKEKPVEYEQKENYKNKDDDYLDIFKEILGIK